MVRSKARKLLAFTLVELLVVIGIIALLISILLPVLGKVRDEANTVACAAGERSVMQGVLIYASQNRGSMPYGYALNFMKAGAPGTGESGISSGSNTWYDRYSWTTLVNNIFTHDAKAGMWPNGINQPATILNQMPMFTKVWTCPSVKADSTLLTDTAQFSCYIANPIIMPNQSYEITPSTGNNYDAHGLIALYVPSSGTTSSIGPAKQSQLYPDNAVLWEGPLMPAPVGYYYPSNLCGQFNWSGVDSGTLLYPQLSYLRYRGELGSVPAVYQSTYGDDKPIWMPTRKSELEIYPNENWANEDSMGGLYFTDYYPGPRYRHQKNTVCNVAFADGSVRGLKWNPLKAYYTDNYGYEVAVNEFTKGMIRIKPPSPLPSPQVPASSGNFPEY